MGMTGGKRFWRRPGAVCIMLLLTLLLSMGAAAETPQLSLGDVVDYQELQVAPGVAEFSYDVKGEFGPQKVFVLDVAGDNPVISFEAGLSEGKVLGMQKTTDQAKRVSEPGHLVVGAVNADFYDMNIGLPLGVVMHEGRILSSPNSMPAIGFKKNGEAIIGYPRLYVRYEINGEGKQVQPMFHINKTRSQHSMVLYTPDYGKSTLTDNEGIEVILTRKSGDIVHGSTLTGIVREVTRIGDNPLSDDIFILSGKGAAARTLEKLAPGDEVALSFELNKEWQRVQEAVAGNIVLLEDGKVEPSIVNHKAQAPRTAIGIREDGSVVLAVVDGRNPGYSDGVNLNQLALLMKDLGAVHALNLDGGGSSTLAARRPGDKEVSVINRPSDGSERDVANSLLIVSGASQGELARIAVLPGRIRLLAGSEATFTAKGQDEAYNPAPLPANIQWQVSGSVGTIDEQGRFTAADRAGTGEVTASADGVEGSALVEVVDELTEIEFPQSEMTVKQGSRVAFTVKAYHNGSPVIADPSLFTWEATGGIGTITDNGVLTATDGRAVGEVQARFGEVVASIKIDIGRPPVVIEDFEKYGVRYWRAHGARYKSLRRSLATAPDDPVRFGQNALRLDYDFTGTRGTSGAYASPVDAFELDGYPEKIGMWVYGDGAGHWLRAQMRDGDHKAFPINFTEAYPNGVTWVGWRYVEAEIPKGKPLPLELELPVRYMATSDEAKNKGTLYIDRIWAVYGKVDDDLTCPVFSWPQPAAGSTITVAKPEIKVVVKDNESGIDPETVVMKLDGKEVEPYYHAGSDSIGYRPVKALTDGEHEVLIEVEDKAGNPAFMRWTFKVSSGGPEITTKGEDRVDAGRRFPLVVAVKNPAGLSGAKLKLHFDPDQVQVVDSDEGKAGIQIEAGENVPAESVVANEVDNSRGEVTFAVADLEGLSGEEQVLATVQFWLNRQAAGSVKVEFAEASIELAHLPREYAPVKLDPFVAEVNYPLSVEIQGVSQGTPTTITVREKDSGQPVAEARVDVVSPQVDWGHPLGITDESGQLTTSKLTEEITSYKLQASKGNLVGPVVSLQVVPAIGGDRPENIVLTPGTDPSTSLTVTWRTAPRVDKSVVQYVPEAEFSDFAADNVQTALGESFSLSKRLGELRVHQVQLSGLKPGTTYVYRVGDGSKTGWSEPLRFTTGPEADQPFTFLFATDTQALTESGFGKWTQLYEKALAMYPGARLAVHAGDICDDGNQLKQWLHFLNASSGLTAKLPLVAVLGNHDVYGDGEDVFRAFLPYPANGPEGEKGLVYSFDYGNVHFVALNSEFGVDSLKAQVEWLREDLKATDKDWTVVIFHRAPYLSNPLRGDDATKTIFAPVLESLGVDLVLVGHDHAYARTYPLRGGKRAADGKGTVYLIGGSAGPKFYPAEDKYDYFDVLFDEDIQLFTRISVDGKKLTIKAVTLDGRAVDEHTIEKK